MLTIREIRTKQVASQGSGGNRSIARSKGSSAWSLEPLVRALQTLRGVDLIVAVTFATEIGGLSRFESPQQLMGYLGLVPSGIAATTICRGRASGQRMRKRSPKPRLDQRCASSASRAPTKQASSMAFKVRDLLVRQRTQAIYALCGHLAEYGLMWLSA